MRADGRGRASGLRRTGGVRWSRAHLRWAAALLVAAVACSAAQRAQAAAAPNVVAVIKARDRILEDSPFTKQVAADEIYRLANASRAKQVQPALTGFTDILSRTVVVLRASSATKDQRLGKADYVTGNLMQVRALHWYAREMTDVLAGKQAAASDAFFRAQVLFGAGNEIANRGDRLLGLSTRY